MYRYELAEDDRVSESVVSLVSAVNDSDPMALPPLADVVDPDALNRFFAHGDRKDRIHRFTYVDYRVTVTSEAIQVEPSTDE